jgi:hypothetical protein
MHETYLHSNEWYSKIDVDMVNTFKYSLLKNFVWYWSTLRAGDCVYIPANYLHQIRSHGRSVSSSVYFTKLFEYDKLIDQSEMTSEQLFTHCAPNAPLFEPMSLFSEQFLWSYTHGERHLTKHEITYEDSVHYLTYLMRNDELLYYERFEHFLNEITRELRNECSKDNFNNLISKRCHSLISAEKVWRDFFQKNNFSDGQQQEQQQRFLNSSQIEKLKQETSRLSRFTQILNYVANFHDLKIVKNEL